MNNVHETTEDRLQNRPTGEDKGLRQRMDKARDIVETVRDRAEIAFHDKPYLVPITAGAVGLGIGMLLGSKLTRFVVFTAVGALLSDALGGEIKRISRDFMDDLQNRLEGEAEGT